MEIGAAFRFPFRSEKWFVNTLLVAVCLLIPVVGPLVLNGYMALLERRLVRDMNDVPPPFDFGEFMKHLERGVAPFVVGLLGGLAMVPVMLVGYVLIIVAMVAAQGNGAVAAVAMVGAFLVFFFGVIA